MKRYGYSTNFTIGGLVEIGVWSSINNNYMNYIGLITSIEINLNDNDGSRSNPYINIFFPQMKQNKYRQWTKLNLLSEGNSKAPILKNYIKVKK